ncbi:MAG: hypothetical protein QXS20_06055 [Candidatus Thorarchaeota archaeon]
MQLHSEELFYLSIGVALLVQFAWLVMDRRGSKEYVQALLLHARPRSPLARLYGWSLDSTWHTIMEGLAVVAVIFSSVVSLSLYLSTTEELVKLLPMLLAIVLLAGIGVAQNAFKVRKLSDRESSILEQLERTTDVVGTARQMVDTLIAAGPTADGVAWLILYRISLRQDRLGWAVRDVLMERKPHIVAPR